MLSYFFLPSQKAPLLLIPYHFTIPPTSKNSIFIKILLFYLSLIFLSIQNCLGLISFSWAFQPFIFSQGASTSCTNHKHNHRHKQTQTHADKKKIITGADLKPKHDQSKPRPRPRRPTTHFNRRSMTNDPFILARRSTTTTQPRRSTTHNPQPLLTHAVTHDPNTGPTTQPRTTTNHPNTGPNREGREKEEREEMVFGLNRG